MLRREEMARGAPASRAGRVPGAAPQRSARGRGQRAVAARRDRVLRSLAVAAASAKLETWEIKLLPVGPAARSEPGCPERASLHTNAGCRNTALQSLRTNSLCSS